MCTNTTLPMFASAPATMATAISTKKRRTVRFDQDESRRVKRKIVHLQDVPTASDMTPEERSTAWLQRADQSVTVQDVNQVIASCQQSGGPGEPQEGAYVHFATALATMYNLCNTNVADNNNNANTTTDVDEANAQRKLPLDQLVLLGAAHTATRGLESKIIPGLGSHRFSVKREHASKILQVQRDLRTLGIPQADLAEGLGALAEVLSQPSKRFARALGVVDGTLALLEYAEADEEENETAAVAVAVAPPQPSSLNQPSSSILAATTVVA